MKYYIAMINDVVIAKDITFAKSFYTRLKGLLLRKSISSDEGLLISPCNQVHTFGMKFCIDVLFLSPSGTIMHIEKNMDKGRISKCVKEASQVLELKAGTVEEKNISLGKNIIFTR